MHTFSFCFVLSWRDLTHTVVDLIHILKDYFTGIVMYDFRHVIGAATKKMERTNLNCHCNHNEAHTSLQTVCIGEPKKHDNSL